MMRNNNLISITRPFKKIADKLILLLSKLKVFQQVLIIIALMILFLGIQGYRSVKIIDIMQNSAFKAFDQSMRGQSDISDIKATIQLLRYNYLVQLTKKGQQNPYNITILQAIGTINSLELKDKTTSEQLINSLNEIKDILTEPVTDANFYRLQKVADTVTLSLDILGSSVHDSGSLILSTSTKFSSGSRRDTLIIVILSAIIAICIGLAIASSVARPLKEMEVASRSLAKGDLSKNISIVGCADAQGTVHGLNQAIDSLRQLIQKIDEQAESLYHSSKDLKDSSKETGRSSQNVAIAMEELARAMTEQTTQITRAVDAIHLLSGLIEEVASETENLAFSSQKVAQSAKLGQQTTDSVASEMNHLFESTQEIAGEIYQLNKTSEEISEITSVIQGIAEQTALLALNAAIEAARAGNQGKGFSVVAAETGKLAEQSKNAARLIASLIMQMKNRAEQAVVVIEKGTSRAETGRNLVVKASANFEEIFTILMDNLTQIDTLAKSTKRMAENSTHVTGAISAIAAISEETMASTEEVSATTEEQSAASQEVTSLADNLTGIASKLKESVEVFKI